MMIVMIKMFSKTDDLCLLLWFITDLDTTRLISELRSLLIYSTGMVQSHIMLRLYNYASINSGLWLNLSQNWGT